MPLPSPPDDTALAKACADGDEEARRAFTERFGPEIDRVQARFARRIDKDDARQLVFSRLFVSEGATPARIGAFRGEGSLGAFVRAVALRALLNAVEKKTEDPLADSMLEALAGPPNANDPETAVRHAEQTRLVKDAFEAASRRLEPRERAILRYALVEGASIDAIGGLYGVHRATAARWLEAAKESLGRAMKEALGEGTKGAAKDREGLHASIASHLDLSIERVLRTGRVDSR